MAGIELALAVRQQLGIGRVLPLGGPADGSWITERAAAAVLRAAVGTTAGMRLGALRLTVADPAAGTPAVPPPPSALPPGPLRITADLRAPDDRPLPGAADELRAALLAAADRELGLVVGSVDLRISGLLTADEEPAATDTGAGREPAATETGAPPETGGAPQDGTEGQPDGPDSLAAVVLGVPGVAGLAPALGGRSRALRPHGGHVLIQLATAPGRRALDVARAVRLAVAAAQCAPETIAVLVTAVGRG
ncbi:hypothetical protein [Streptomyces sp. NPDC048650]|uniref:hypothetical protein n=1 Tax=Streptomyces sp. NPDC048650 TaxID=3365583 RepID=UPI00371C661C